MSNVSQPPEARKNHYVPQFLLEAWAIDDILQGYWWNPWKSALVSKSRGPKAFCNQLDLLTLNRHALGRDAIERVFFGFIDTRGSLVYDKLLAQWNP